MPDKPPTTIYSLHIVKDSEIVYTSPAVTESELESEARELPWDLVTEKAQVKIFNLNTEEYVDKPI